MQGDPTDILNWRRVDHELTLSGQPTAAQLRQLQAIDVTTIVNLGPDDSPKALPGEREIVTKLGLAYVHIPVDFAAPTQADFETFCAALDARRGERLHIHCIYNARVSAFMLRRAQEGRGGSVPQAQALMDSIWRPGGVWAAFLGHAEAQSHPNRYAGVDY